MRTRKSDLGRRNPGGGRVRCREYVPIKKDTLGQVVAQFAMTGKFGIAYTWREPVAQW